MPIYHYDPPIGDRKSLTNDDPAGWYEFVVRVDGVGVTSTVYWWNSRELNHGPNKRRGFKVKDIANVISINRLYAE